MLKRPPHRVTFREKEEIIDLPNLIEIQIKSYHQFLQSYKFPHMRGRIWDCKKCLQRFSDQVL